MHSTTLTAALLVALIGITSLLVLSAATAYSPPSMLQESDPIVPTYNQADIDYLKQIARDRATYDFYVQAIGNEEIVHHTLAAAREQGIADVEVLFALMWLESRYNAHAVNINSTSIDRGLFQLNSTVYTEYPEYQFFNIEWNIRTGVRHYATELAVVDGQHRYALHAYNAGRSRRFNPPDLTQRYAQRILSYAQNLRDQKTQYIDHAIAQELAQYTNEGDL